MIVDDEVNVARDKAKPIVVKLHELQPNQPPVDTFALLTEKTRGTTRDQKPFFTVKFRDARRTVGCVVWADSPTFADCETRWVPGTLYKIRCTFVEHEKYGPQIEVHRLRDVTPEDRDNGLNEADFADRSQLDPATAFADLRRLAETELHDVPLRTLTLTILDAVAERLLTLPASPRQFYPYPGGWLEHTLHVVRNCVWLADQYAERFPRLKPFNRDVVVAGAILHDIGRVDELTPGRPGEPADVTVPGHLFGHVILGRDRVRAAAAGVPDLNPELVQLLEHVLVAHLTRPEWGSPRLPVIPEVLIVHHADDLDAKFEMFARCLTRDAAIGPLTDRDAVLGKALLKGRTV